MAAANWIMAVVATVDPARRDARVLAGTLIVIVVLLLAMILLIVQRAVRQRIMRERLGEGRPARTAVAVDPWFEAGRRAKPIEVGHGEVDDLGEEPEGGGRRGPVDDEPDDPRGPRGGRGGGA